MAPQDSFIEEDEECCPLCVEEFDLSDRNFRPCPCGYQICQFCFNNIKTNLNGLCPACRRAYSDDSIQWKVVTPEEMAQFKANAQKTAKKKQELRQKEVQKKEVETLDRKRLSGLRVIQKNLVYVMGLSPSIPEKEILETLRGDKYFGQYGEITKIVVSHKKIENTGSGPSMGVYVTFKNAADAQRCISAVNGSQNGDRTLRAQLGTTKYCSAYLRHETCNNKNCMFLHEPGDNEDSYSRQDLSSINSASTQRPLIQRPFSSASASSSRTLVNTPLQHVVPMAAATQPMIRESSRDGSDSGDGSALPTTASWATKSGPQRSRGGSVTSGAAYSPAFSHVVPAVAETSEESEGPEPEPAIEETIHAPASEIATSSTSSSRPKRDPILVALLRAINSPALVFPSPGTDGMSDDSDLKFPPLFDQQGGEKRRAMRESQEEEARLQLEQDPHTEEHSVAEPAEEEEPESGSLQLGGEPEDRDNTRDGRIPQGSYDQRRPSTQLPIQRGSNGGPFGPSLSQNFSQNLSNVPSINGRTLTPLQQHQLLLMKSAEHRLMETQYPPGMGGQADQGSGLFQGQGHNRQSSRYSFANDGSSTTSSVKPSANAKAMAQQSSMMPSVSHNQGGQFYGSSMPGPPPGLKSATPPMYGQHQAFGGSSSGSIFGGGQRENNDLLREMLRSRGGGQSHDMKPQHDLDLHSDDEATKTVDQLVAESEEDFEHRSVNGSEYMSRSSTPSVPPGFGPPGLGPPGFGNNHAHPMAASREEPIAKPASRIVPTSAPFTPGRSTAFIPRAGTPLSHVLVPTTPAMPAAVDATPAVPAVFPEPPVSQAKQDVKALAAKTGLSTAIAAQSAKPALQSEDFPALDSGKGKGVMTPAPSKAVSGKAPLTASTKKAPVLASAQPTSAVSKASEKRATAGLNIPVPSKPTPKPVIVSENVTVPIVGASAFPPLPASTPGPSVQSPMPRAAPKTLRLTASTKIETPTAGSATPSSASSAYPASLLPSRQASLVLNARTERPGTPTSELISDNASITSASISRPNSPPISNRVGSAPVRLNTKSMAKKQRLEKRKELTEIDVVAAKVEPEVEIAPIMGRKKKVKKERIIHSAAGGSTPAASRPQSPGPAESPSGDQNASSNSAEPPIVTKSEKPSPIEPEVKPIVKTVDVKGNGKGKTPASPVPDLNPSVVEAEDEVLDKPIPTPAAVFQDLLSAQVIEDAEGLFFLKPPVVIHRHQDPPIDMQSVNQKLTITPEDRATLLAGLPVHKIAEGPNRIMLTPNGDCVRNLTPEEEMRYLDLQSAISEESGATAFVSPKHHANNGFTLIGGRAVPNGPPSFFPIFNTNAPPMDPVSKIQRDEALSYINQYVLPSLSTNSQLEKALNANALDTEILRSSDASAWASWGTDPASTHPNNGDGREGMLGLEHMTAQFAVSGDNRGQPLGNVSLLSLNEAESAMQLARKETDGLEKRLNALIKKNRRLLLGSGH